MFHISNRDQIGKYIKGSTSTYNQCLTNRCCIVCVMLPLYTAGMNDRSGTSKVCIKHYNLQNANKLAGRLESTQEASQRECNMY